MIINLSTIDFDGGGGGSAKPAKLQEKTTDIEANGTTNVFPDEGFDGISLLSLRANIPNASALDFNVIGYDEDFSSEVNAKINNDVAYSKSLYDKWNPNNTSADNLYKNDKKLIYAPNIDLSNVTSISGMYQGCESLESVPLLITSKVTRTSNMFMNCANLTSIPHFDTSNVQDMSYTFQNCEKLRTIPHFDTSKVQNLRFMFSNCEKLESLPLLECGNVTDISTFFGYYAIEYLTEIGGFKNLKIDWKDNYGLAKLPYLSYESILNVLNNLYDFRGNGDSTTTRTIKFHANALAQMTDEDKAIATNKGWVIS